MNIQEICNEFKWTCDKDIRDALKEFIDMSGINDLLLRTINNNGNVSKKSQYNFPEQDLEFIKWALESRTKKDFKRLRQARYNEASIEVREKIVNGWLAILRHLNRTPKEIRETEISLNIRFWTWMQHRHDKLTENHGEFFQTVSSSSLNIFDKLAILDYVIANPEISDTSAHQLFDDFTDIRTEENYEIAEAELDAGVDDVLYLEHYYIDCKVSENTEYQQAQKDLYNLLRKKGMRMPLTPKYNKLITKIEHIRNQYSMELLGHTLAPFPKKYNPISRKSPQEIILECLTLERCYKNE